ncbi:hypothetical protein TWF481_001884 [Arthrobotrys musiformis]|uniref:Uncharacterized protein n=1 Tax=Arthrobotrys musiformis TaxID=47236 RepID=A0AAV9VVN9_9PEZI
MWLDENIRLQRLLAGIFILTGHAYAAPEAQPNGGGSEGGNGGGSGNNALPGGGITPTWGNSPNRGFTFPSTPYTPQTGMNTLDTSRTSGMANSPLAPPNTNPLLSQPGRIPNRPPQQNYDNSMSMHNSNSNSPDTSGYDSPELGFDPDVPDTEPDELLYPKLSQRKSFPDTPSQMLEKNLFDRESNNNNNAVNGITLASAIKALGIREPEENIKNISPFIDLPKTPPTSGTNTPRYDISGQTTPQDSRRTSRFESPRYGSPLARGRFTISNPISMVSMGDDEGNVEEDEEELAVNVPVFEKVTDYPGLEFTGPKKVSPVDIDTGSVFMSSPTEKEISDQKIPSLQSVPQDTIDPAFQQAFVITPGGASSASTKINAIIDEHGQMILAA